MYSADCGEGVYLTTCMDHTRVKILRYTVANYPSSFFCPASLILSLVVIIIFHSLRNYQATSGLATGGYFRFGGWWRLPVSRPVWPYRKPVFAIGCGRLRQTRPGNRYRRRACTTAYFLCNKCLVPAGAQVSKLFLRSIFIKILNSRSSRSTRGFSLKIICNDISLFVNLYAFLSFVLKWP